MNAPLRILLTDKNGQVGFELQRLLPRLGSLVALDRRELDLSNPAEIRRVVREIQPGLIVNAAAYTAVDQAETDQAAARSINSEAPAVLAEEAKRIGAALVHYSTDYVFDGLKSSPYCEDDPTNPLSVYGQTKLAGEGAIRQVGIPHLIFRTARVYSTRGRNFMLTILRLASQREDLWIVRDQASAHLVSRHRNRHGLRPSESFFGLRCRSASLSCFRHVSHDGRGNYDLVRFCAGHMRRSLPCSCQPALADGSHVQPSSNCQAHLAPHHRRISYSCSSPTLFCTL